MHSAFRRDATVMLAQKIRVAYPIFLVLVGLVNGFMPGIPALNA
jgi:hypothetical protein